MAERHSVRSMSSQGRFPDLAHFSLLTGHPTLWPGASTQNPVKNRTKQLTQNGRIGPMTPRIRTVTTASGATAVQIIHSYSVGTTSMKQTALPTPTLSWPH